MVFIPVADNPLHRNSLDGLFFHDPLPETTNDERMLAPLYTSFSLQRSCLKHISLGGPKEVRWLTPLSTFKIIPARNDPVPNGPCIEWPYPNPNDAGHSQSNTTQYSSNMVPNETSNTYPSSPSLEIILQQQPQLAPQTGAIYSTPVSSAAADAFAADTFSITKTNKQSDAQYFPLAGMAFKTASQAVISARNQPADPVAFTTQSSDGPTYHETTTKLNLHHLSKHLHKNTPTTPLHLPSPDVTTNQAVTPQLPPLPPPFTLLPKSKFSHIPSHSTETSPPLTFPWAVHHHPSPGLQATSSRTWDGNKISSPKVFGSRNSNQQGQISALWTGGVKRKAINMKPVERPSKFPKVNENLKAGKGAPFRWKISKPTSVDSPMADTHGNMPGAGRSSLGFPQCSRGQDEDVSSVGNSDADGPATSDDPADSDDSLFGDSVNFDHANKFQKSGKYSQERRKFKKPDCPRIRSVSRLTVIHWVNELKRFQYLRDSGKMDVNVVGELHQLLNEIDKQKDDPYLTPKILGDMQLGRLVSEFRHGRHGKASKVVADGIAKVWRHLCREVSGD